MFKKWQGFTLAAAMAWCPALAWAGGGHEKDAKTPAQIQQLLSESQKPLTDLVRSAETKTGGKAFCATICEWKNVQPKFAQVDSKIVSGTKADTTKFAPNHPVGIVKTHANNKIVAAVVCSTTGEVLATKECDKYEPGKSAYLDDGDRATMVTTGQNTHAGTMANSSRYSYETWNRAPTRWQKAQDLIGKDVTNRATNEAIGDIKDLAVDPDNGRVIYAMVEFDNKMGHGSRWYAMPLGSLTLTPDAKSVQIDYSAAQINDANGFDSKNWPNVVDEKWSAQVHQNFNQREYWRYPEGRHAGTGVKVSHTDATHATMTQAPRRWQKMSDLIGKQVKNQQNEDLGTIKDVAVDPDSGRILYGVLSFGGFLGLGDKFFAIPWSALQLTPDAKHVVLAVEKDRLKNAEGFEKNSWPNMADERWATNVHQFYNRPTYWNQSNQNTTGQIQSDQDLKNQNVLRENGDNP